MEIEEMRKHAERLIRASMDNFEYSDVYEDCDLEDMDGTVWEPILDLMYAADVRITWKE